MSILRRAFLSIILLSPIFGSISFVSAQQLSHDLKGSWLGFLILPTGEKVHVVVNIRNDDGPEYVGSFASPDQTSQQLPIQSFAVKGDSVRIEIANPRARIVGAFSADGNTITAQFLQGGASFELVFHRSLIYLGALGAGDDQLRLAFKIAADDGKQIGTLESLDQGDQEFTLDSIIFNKTELSFAALSIVAEFSGTHPVSGDHVTGTWHQGGHDTQIELQHVAAVPVIRRPQDPVKPYPYIEEIVTVPDTVAHIKLAGTLTIPKGKGPFPAVFLITGSGAQNRDEELLGHRPFLVLADYLTRKGIEVLRVDDRGIGSSTGNFLTATSRDFAMDAKSAIQFLKTRKEVDPKQIGLIGHSEGGMIAPMVAAHDTAFYSDPNDVAFIVLLAGPGVKVAELMDIQRAMLSRVGGMSEAAIALSGHYLRQSDSVVIAGGSPKAIRPILDSLWTLAFNAQTGKESEDNKPNVDQIRYAQVQQMLSPWYRYFIAYDPAPVLMKVHCPVLAINGSLDHQVSAKEDLDGIRTALSAGGNKDYEVKELPDLNHLLQKATTGSGAEYQLIKETINPAALETVSSWILRHTHTPKE